MVGSAMQVGHGIPQLETKFYVPQWRPGLVFRPKLVQRLDQSAGGDSGHNTGRKLTLVSAPAGFGKTTLLAEWLAAGKGSAGWVSLDPGDNGLALFRAYVINAQRPHQALGCRTPAEVFNGERAESTEQATERRWFPMSELVDFAEAAGSSLNPAPMLSN